MMTTVNSVVVPLTTVVAIQDPMVIVATTVNVYSSEDNFINF